MKKALLWLLLLAVVLSALTFLTPHLIARGLEMGLYRTLGTDVSVRLAAYPSLRLLLGQFEQIEVEAQNVNLGGLVADQYALVAEKVAVNMRELLTRRELRFRNDGHMQVRVVVAEGELSKFLWERIPQLAGWRIQIHAGRATVLGQVPLLNAKVDIAVQGKFLAVGQDKIAFVPEGIEIFGAPLPAASVGAVMQDAQFHIDLASAPMPLELLDVKMEPGQLVVVARVLQ